MSQKKYKLTDEITNVYDFDDGKLKNLYRIEALRNFSDVHQGDKGGFVESEKNLSQDGECWVYDSAVVYSDAIVKDNAVVCDNSRISDNAIVQGSALVHDHSVVRGNAIVSDSVSILDDVIVEGNANISDFVDLHNHVMVSGNAKISNYASLFNSVKVKDNVTICGDACIFGIIYIEDNVYIKNAIIKSSEIITIKDNAVIEKNSDFQIYRNNWSSYRFLIWTRSNDMWSVGCFYGTGKALVEKAYLDSENKGKHYELLVKMNEEMCKIDEEYEPYDVNKEYEYDTNRPKEKI